MKLYTKTYKQRLTREIEGFEVLVSLPDMPPRKEMVNYDLPVGRQKFYRTEVPHDIRNWEKKREDQFVKEEWHKRLNGIWILIKGEPVYITGPAYVFFNYWHTEFGPLPDFRMEAVDYFQVWDHILNTPKCYGLLDIKCRRVGDTEKALFCGWELVTRYKNSNFGMQKTTDEEAWKNFKRVIRSNKLMVYFFKPVPFDSDTPQKIMEFRYPKRKNNKQKTKGDIKYDPKTELNSVIDYRATELKAYDGERLRYYYLDEPGKISPAKMHVAQQWSIVKLCLTMNVGAKIVGKAALTTTVEKFGDGSTVQIMQDLWDMSNPNNLSEVGETATGLFRWFRGYKYASPVDEYGHHDVEAATKEREAKIKQFTREKKFDELTAYMRQFPASIEESLVPPSDECSFNAHLLDEQIRELGDRLLSGRDWPTRPTRGNLVWVAGFGSDVKWVPDPRGRWEISGHPPVPNQRRRTSVGGWMPESSEFAGGCDPVDHMKPAKDGSDAAIVIGALLNMSRENVNLLEYDEYGNITNAEVMVSDRAVCIYRNRPVSPYDFYDDVIKTVVYYGCRINVETQKPGVINYMNEKGFGGYVANQPITTDVKGMAGQKKMLSQGTPANEQTIGAYIEAIKVHVDTRSRTYSHMDLLKDMRFYNGADKKNRTKRDLTVAWGWCRVLLNAMSYISTKYEKKTGWEAPAFRTYEYQNDN